MNFENVKVGYRRTRNMKTIEAFIKSGLRRVEIIEYPHADAVSARNGFKQTIRRMRYSGIRASVRKGKVFLVNDNIEEVKLTYYNE